MNEKDSTISPFSIAFILIGALFGAAFASGQEVMKFFCSYGVWGRVGLVICFFLYVVFGYMTYELSRIRGSENMENIVSPADNVFIKKFISAVMMFCFAVITMALFAAGDSLFTTQLNFPKGVGGFIIAALVIITNIVGFDGIKKIMPVIIPVMLIIMLGISIIIIVGTEHTEAVNPQRYMSPLAPNWFIGALLYLSYNFLVTIPVISTLTKIGTKKKNAVLGMFLGFLATCVFGFLLYCALMTDVDVAGQYDIPMAYLSSKISPLLSIVYSLIMVIAIYSASSNCMYGLTKKISKDNKKKRSLVIIIIGAVAYLISLVGFSQLVTYGYPIQGYACILIMICVFVTYIKYRKRQI